MLAALSDDRAVQIALYLVAFLTFEWACEPQLAA
jgi:hypothetical protein